jgi:hypothetical protein
VAPRELPDLQLRCTGCRARRGRGELPVPGMRTVLARRTRLRLTRGSVDVPDVLSPRRMHSPHGECLVRSDPVPSTSRRRRATRIRAPRPTTRTEQKRAQLLVSRSRGSAELFRRCLVDKGGDVPSTGGVTHDRRAATSCGIDTQHVPKSHSSTEVLDLGPGSRRGRFRQPLSLPVTWAPNG